MKADEGGITHMAKAKLSKGLEFFGEHLLILQKQAQVERLGRASFGHRLKR